VAVPSAPDLAGFTVGFVAAKPVVVPPISDPAITSANTAFFNLFLSVG